MDLAHAPGTLWMTGFLLASLLLVATLAFGTTDPLGNPRFGLNFDNFAALADPAYRTVLLRSLGYALITCLICLAVAYPVAYAIALRGGRFKNLLIAAIVVPFFANYLVRMYGWSVVLSDDGPLLKALRTLGIADEGTKILQTGPGVIAGLVYGFIVFMIIPLYAAMERMDTSLIEAGRDLYGGPCAPSASSPSPPPGRARPPAASSCSCPPWATSSAPSSWEAPTRS
ncbi:ABC transporter permease [Streptomyces sp. MS1.HAVA.3]|uniref:ABC transporter permease n=1 Tax=Streptomyces caledonius TaxID=3134107 RepID=A0ABU8UC80_9ACTN